MRRIYYSMKSIIEYQYGISVDKIEAEDNKYIVTSNNNKYILKQIDINHIRLIESNLNDNRRYAIVKNINGEKYIKYNEKYYYLFKLDNRNNIDLFEISKNKAFDFYIENNIVNLWIHKNDYMEKLMEDVNRDYIIETKDYYLGLAEQAIMIVNGLDLMSNKKVLCHKRINKKEYRVPDNLTIDYKERDIGEYIKYLIFEEKEKIEEIKKKIDLLIKYKVNIILIIARILYPSEYFDLIDEYSTGKEIKRDLQHLLSREKYRHIIINYINKKRGKPL